MLQAVLPASDPHAERACCFARLRPSARGATLAGLARVWGTPGGRAGALGLLQTLGMPGFPGVLGFAMLGGCTLRRYMRLVSCTQANWYSCLYPELRALPECHPCMRCARKQWCRSFMWRICTGAGNHAGGGRAGARHQLAPNLLASVTFRTRVGYEPLGGCCPGSPAC